MKEADIQRRISSNEDRIIEQVQQHLFENVFNDDTKNSLTGKLRKEEKKFMT